MLSDTLDALFRRTRLAERCRRVVTSWDERPPVAVESGAWRFLFGIVRRDFRWNVAALVAFAALAQMAELAVPWFLGSLVGSLSSAATAADPQRPLIWLAGLVAAWVSALILSRLYEVIDIYTSPGLRMISQKTLLAHLLGHSSRFFHDNLAGKLGQKVKQVGQSCVSLTGIFCNDVVRVLVVLVGGTALLLAHDPFYGVLLLAWTVGFLAVSAYFARRSMAMSTAFADVVSTATGRLVDTVSNVDLVRSFARSRHERRFVGAALNDEMREAQRFRWFITLSKFAQAAITLVLLAGLAVLTVQAVRRGAMDVGSFVTVFTLIGLVANNVQALANRLLELFEQAGIIVESVALISRPHDIVDAPDAAPLEAPAGGIAFRGVRFAYPGGDTVLRDIDLTIRPGEKVGLVGRSGSGKSTLIRLLRRDYDVSAGAVEIDGRDVRTIRLDSLRETIAEVPQSSAMFHRPIGANIGYGDLDADQAAIAAAAARAGARTFIEARDEAYATMVGEQGLRLSGGERQRVAVARAILKRARILVLDEATSALDTETELHVQSALREVAEGRTVIAIAHRLSTLLSMDRILVLDRGTIVEEGSHHALLARDGLYARLWRLQSGSPPPAPGAQESAAEVFLVTD